VLPASVQDFVHRVIDAPAAPPAAHHRHGAPGQASHPGGGPSSSAGAHSVHPAKPGTGKTHKGRHRGRHLGTGAKKPKPKPSHPAHQAKPHPSHSPSPATR
jgi:hypothetical protein